MPIDDYSLRFRIVTDPVTSASRETTLHEEQGIYGLRSFLAVSA
jgi:hypothetical protein